MPDDPLFQDTAETGPENLEPTANRSESSEIIDQCTANDKKLQESAQKIGKLLETSILSKEEKDYFNLLLGHIKDIQNTQNDRIKSNLMQDLSTVFGFETPQQIEQELEKKVFLEGTPEVDDETAKYKQPLTVAENWSEAVTGQLLPLEKDPENPHRQRDKRYKVVLPNGEVQYIKHVRNDPTDTEKGSGHFHRSGETKRDKIDQIPAGATISEIEQDDIEQIAQLEIRELLETPQIENLKDQPIYTQLLDELLYQNSLEKTADQEKVVEESIKNIAKESESLQPQRNAPLSLRAQRSNPTEKQSNDEIASVTALPLNDKINATMLPENYQPQSENEAVRITELQNMNQKLIDFAGQPAPTETNPAYQNYLREKQEVEQTVAILEMLANDAITNIEQQTPTVAEQGIDATQMLHEALPYEVEPEKVFVFRQNITLLENYKKQYLA